MLARQGLMGYRDETAGLKARVAELETELAEAKAAISRLKGEGAPAKLDDDQKNWFLGEHSRFHLEEELDFEVSEEAFEALAAHFRRRWLSRGAQGGQISQVGRTLTITTPAQVLTVTRSNATSKSKVSLTANLQGIVVVQAVAALCVGLFGSIPFIPLLKHGHVSPAWLLLIMPAMILSVYGATRALFGRWARSARKTLSGDFEAAIELTTEHSPQNVEVAPARVRVEEAVAEEGLETDELEAEAEARTEQTASRS